MTAAYDYPEIPVEALLKLRDKPGCYALLLRPDGTKKLIKVPDDQWQRLMALAEGECGDKSIVLIGPELPAK